MIRLSDRTLRFMAVAAGILWMTGAGLAQVRRRAVQVPQATVEGANLALNATVRASSSFDQPGWAPGFAVDGIRQERPGARGWSSQGDSSVNHAEWIMIDLGENRGISRVDLYPRNDERRAGESFPIDFDIQVSQDGDRWTTVLSRNNYPKPGPEVQRFAFEPASGRFVRIVGRNLRYLGAESAYYMQFTEIEVYGTAAAPGKTGIVVPGASAWSGEVVLPGGERQVLTIAIDANNRITGQIGPARVVGGSARRAVTGSLDPATGEIRMQYATRTLPGAGQGTLTGRLESTNEAAGTISIRTAVAGRAVTTEGTWRLIRK